MVTHKRSLSMVKPSVLHITQLINDRFTFCLVRDLWIRGGGGI